MGTRMQRATRARCLGWLHSRTVTLHWRRWWKGWLVSALALILATGCSDSAPLSDTPVGVEAGENPDDGDGGNQAPAPVRALTLALQSDPSVLLTFGEQTTTRVVATYSDDGSIAEDVALTYALVATGADLPSGTSGAFIDAAAASGSELQWEQVTTDGNGLAANKVLAGTNRTQFDLLVWAAGVADALRIPMQVDGAYFGDLRVSFENNAPVSLYGVQTQLYQGSHSPCEQADPAAIGPAVGELSAGSVADAVVYTGLTERLPYTVLATATNLSGVVVASGCAVSAPIEGRGEVAVQIPLSLTAPQVGGLFDFGTRLHLQEAIPGQPGAIVGQVTDFFADPAAALSDQIIALAADQLNVSPETAEGLLTAAWFVYALSNGITPDRDGDGEVVDDAITFALLDQLPPWAVDGLTIGDDITSLLADMAVGGQLDLSQPNASGALTGEWVWNTYMFQWRYGEGCNFTDSCCGRQVYSGAEMGLEAVRGAFNGMVVAAGPSASNDEDSTDSDAPITYALTTDEHQMVLAYGNIIWFLLERVVLPAATGADTLEGAISLMLGCDNAADPSTCGCGRAGPWLEDALNLPTGLGRGMCDLALAGISSGLENQLQDMAFDGTDNAAFVMRLEADLVDDNRDAVLERLEGTVAGTFQVQGGSTSFTGEVTGATATSACGDDAPEPDATCPGGMSCVARPGVLNECAESQVCWPS